MGKCESYMQHGTMHLCYSMDRPSECKCGGDQNLCELPPEKSKKPKAVELKPCPFCGGEAEYRPAGGMSETCGYVRCKNFCCEQHWYSPEKEAIEAWNRRADNGNEA